jgi:glucose 1-dehydrogenase
MTDPATRKLEGRRALVTGGATGIGRATVERLASEGASVAVNYVDAPGPAEELVGTLERGTAIEADVSSEEQVVAMFRRAAEELGGPVDLLVNNAGIEKPFPLVEMPLAEWEKVLAVNLTGVFLCSREAARGLVDAGRPGVIVNNSSVHELIPWPRFSHYCASKSGVKLFAQTIARELAPYGIRVVNVAPGAIATPINRDWLDDPEAVREVQSQIPLERIGAPEEIAAAIAWLASPEADYVTGTTLFVDGGMSTFPKMH